MKNKIVLPLILFLLLGFISLHGQQGLVLKKDIVVAEGEVQDNVITLGGNVLIEGEVKQDIVAFGGSITVRGRVGGDIVGGGSDIALESSAIVNGDVYSIGGVLDKEQGCVIKGDTVYFKTSEDVSKFLKETFRSIFTVSFIPFILITKLLLFFIWFIIAIVIAALLPRQISFASSQIRKSFWPVFGIGFLSIIIYVGFVIFSAILCFVLIGIPILLFFVILGIAVQIFGRVIIFYFLGESLFKVFGKSKISPLGAVIIGLVLFTLIRFIPIIGFLFSFCLSILGWGVVIRTKFGTTENWFKRS